MKTLGANLRTARPRRNLTIREAGERIGTDPRTVSNAEKGKPSTAIDVYAALLWAYGLLEPVAALAEPRAAEEGLTLAR